MSIAKGTSEDRQIRVLLDGRVISDHFPGIGRYTFHLALALHTLPHIHLTVLLNPHVQNTRFPPLQTLLPSEHILPLPGSPFDPTAQWRIPLHLRGSSYHIYHSPYYLFPYLIPLPTVVTLHDTIPTRFPTYFPPLKRHLIRGLKYLATRKASHLITDSHATAEDVARFYRVPPERITRIPLAPAPHFRPQPPARVEHIRRKYGLPPTYALYLGSTKPHKNVDLLLRVWEKSRGQWGNRQCPLVLAGLAQTAPDSLPEGVMTLGVVPEGDLPALYAGARVFLFPSLYEGFGLPVLEAMACGTPVLCTDIPVLAEVAGDAALRLPPTEDAWSDAIARLCQDEEQYEVWRAKGLEQAARFSWERTAQATAEVYERVTSNE
ncbi:MAG: glycosyltransferase family 4 protein [Chloroflexi bacterium]|nr:glycosyltransferase family 4 protein [Chloroflexota bacterium]